MKFPRLKLGTKIALLSFGLVLLSVLLVGVTIVIWISDSTEEEMGMRAMAIARTLAQLSAIQDNLGQKGGERVIQPIAERIRLATGVEYIVVFDMNKIRYSHPLADRIGTPFVDGDEERALLQQEYLSRARGVRGPSIRAFVPVLTDEGTRQVGVVAVGVLTPTLAEILKTIRYRLYSSLLVGLAFGIAGSFYLARNIKKNMFRLEPEEIARVFEERVAILQALGEGVIAVNTEGKITLINKEACRITGTTAQCVGQKIEQVVGHTDISLIIRGGVEYNSELFINKQLVLANFLPVRLKERIVGAVMTFRDKTDFKRLAEELTGVKTFIEALRVQNHEYLNKLHTIAGLIQLTKYQEASDYIFEVTEEQQEVTQFLSKRIRNPSVAGLLLGKFNRAKELKIILSFDEDSCVGELPSELESSNLVIILGNLLENAFEAVADKDLREVHCLLSQRKTELVCAVEDTGHGIRLEDQTQIFEWGFTTKGSENRGIGLYIVKKIINKLNGSIEIESGNWGTRFQIRIPLGTGCTECYEPVEGGSA
ncbi:MAG: sensor histidine kinase [Desulfitobacterium hafniense]|nr:sensor histidine kinase [Desulfitobacterium hafniense]